MLNENVDNIILQLANDYGMERIEYDDAFYYDFHFNLENGIEILKPKLENKAWVLQFKEDLSYAQLCSPTIQVKELTIDECLVNVLKLRQLSKVLKF